jgi:hypothetical protein
MNGSSSILLLLAAIGAGIYVVMKNQPVTVAGQGAVPITTSGPLSMNCPGDPGCPGNINAVPGGTSSCPAGQTYFPPSTDDAGDTIPGVCVAGLSGLFQVRGPGGWAA